MGKPGMPWQREAWNLSTELLDDGAWAYSINVWTVPRQSGKTTGFGPLAHERAVTCPGKCWWTAQTRQDARDSWLDMLELIGRSPLGQVADVRKSNGSEAVTYPGGGTFRPFAPTEDALHGKANELVAVDEAWAHDAAQGAALDQAILPTFTTTGGQLFIISTAGTAWSTWLLGYVERARAAVLAGRTDTIALVEYGIDDATAAVVSQALTRWKAEPGDERLELEAREALELVLLAHPAYGHTLKLSALWQAAEGMSPGDFLRAYGNYWTAAAEQVIPEHAWAARRVPAAAWTPPDPGSVSLTFDVSLDGADAAICAAWRPTPTSPARVDVIDARPGSSWLVPRLLELRERWRVEAPIGCDGAGANLAVAEELARKLGDEDQVHRLTTREFVTANAGFLADVLGGQLEHAGRPDLDEAVRSAARRQIGDSGWGFSRRMSAATIAPLVGAVVARYVLDHRPPPKAAPVVVVRRPAPSSSSSSSSSSSTRRRRHTSARVSTLDF